MGECSGRIIGLDGLRAVSLILVLQAHWGPSAWFDDLAEWGRGGLIIFFVISGFLITRILLNLESTKAALCTFYVRRSFRIFPTYYLALGLVLAFGLNYAVRIDWLWHVLFLNNISNVVLRSQIGDYGPGFPWWSLAVEEQFYALWAPLVLFLPRRWLSPAIVTVLLCGLGFKLACFANDIPTSKAFLITFGNVDALAAGAIVAIMAAKQKYYHTVAIALMVISSVAFGWSVSDRLMIGYADFRASLTGAVTNDAIWYVFFAPLIYLLSTGGMRAVGSLLDNPAMRYIGQRSYGAYVFHHVTATVVERWLPIGHVGPLPFIIDMTLTLIIAAISFRFFEKPIMSLREKIFSKTSDIGRFNYGIPQISIVPLTVPVEVVN